MVAEESQLLSQFIQEQDAQAFAELMERHRPLVASVCRRHLIDSADLEDAIQDTFVKLARHAQEIRGEVGAWLRSVAARTALDFARRSLRERHRRRNWAVLQNVSDEAAMVWEQINQRLQKAIAGLDPETRKLVAWRFYHDLPLQEIAEHQGISTPTISRRVARAVQELREALAEEGREDLGDGCWSDILDNPSFSMHQPRIPGVLWSQPSEASPLRRSSGEDTVIRVGRLVSHESTRHLNTVGSRRYLPGIEDQFWCLPAMEMPKVRFFSIVEPETEGLPHIERGVRLGNLTSGMLDASDAEALKLLDVIVLCHPFALPSSVVRAITEAVESGVGLYHDGWAGSIVPGINDSRMCRLRLTDRAAEYHTSACREGGAVVRRPATVLQSHPIIRGLCPGEPLQVYGCGTVCVPCLGAQMLIQQDTPPEWMAPDIAALRGVRIPVLTVGQLGRGRVVVSWAADVLSAHSGIQGGFFKNTFEWLAEPRLRERMQDPRPRI